jgi:hypothetical protein
MSSPDVRRLLASLNDAQRRAAAHPGGPLEIIAGPGSGNPSIGESVAPSLSRRCQRETTAASLWR